MRQYGGDVSLLQRMLAQFSAYSEDTPAKLRAFAASGDYESLRREAHSLKGSSSYIGAVQLPVLAHRLQEAAQHGDPSQLMHMIEELSQALDVCHILTHRLLDPGIASTF